MRCLGVAEDLHGPGAVALLPVVEDLLVEGLAAGPLRPPQRAHTSPP